MKTSIATMPATTSQALVTTLKCLSQFQAKWGNDWPFVADCQTLPSEDYQFVQRDLPRLIATSDQPRAAMQRFVEGMTPILGENPRQLAAYLSLLTYTALAFRRPYVEKNPENLAAMPVVSEASIQFPQKLSDLWTEVGQRLGIEASTSLTSLVYCNFSCDLADLTYAEDPAIESGNIEALIAHQRSRYQSVVMHFCNHDDLGDRAIYKSFLKIFLYSEIVGKRVYRWAEKALSAYEEGQSPERIVAHFKVMIQWAKEGLQQNLETGEIPAAALAIAQFTPAIKLAERRSTPGVTGFFVPFLDEFFGFTSESSAYLERVRASHPFLLRELADILVACQNDSPYLFVMAQMPEPQRQQLEDLRTELWTVMKEWRTFHRNQVGRFLAKGVVSQSQTPYTKGFLRNFVTNMNERMRAFEQEGDRPS